MVRHFNAISTTDEPSEPKNKWERLPFVFFFSDSDSLTAGSCVNPDKITCWKDLICLDTALFNSILECPNILVHHELIPSRSLFPFSS